MMTHLDLNLPVSVLELEAKCQNLPDKFKAPQLLSRVHAKNKYLIEYHYQEISKEIVRYFPASEHDNFEPFLILKDIS